MVSCPVVQQPGTHLPLCIDSPCARLLRFRHSPTQTRPGPGGRFTRPSVGGVSLLVPELLPSLGAYRPRPETSCTVKGAFGIAARTYHNLTLPNEEVKFCIWQEKIKRATPGRVGFSVRRMLRSVQVTK